MVTYNKNLFKVVRNRNSETQGTASLYYGDTLLELFGDDIDLINGQWQSRHSDDVFLRHGPGLLVKHLERVIKEIKQDKCRCSEGTGDGQPVKWCVYCGGTGRISA